MKKINITIVHGDITKQMFQKQSSSAIVNAANGGMLGGGGIDGAIHNAAGPYLRQECKFAPEIVIDSYIDKEDNSKRDIKVRCPTGEAKLTLGHNLAPLRIIHTVGPTGENPNKETLLEAAYRNCLLLADTPQLAARPSLNSDDQEKSQYYFVTDLKRDQNGKWIEDSGKKTRINSTNCKSYEHPITAIAFNCISTAIFGYNIKEATPIAIKTVLRYLRDTPNSQIKEIRFVVFSVNDYTIYKELFQKVCANGGEMGEGDTFNIISLTNPNPDLHLEESSIGGGGEPQKPLCFRFVRDVEKK